MVAACQHPARDVVGQVQGRCQQTCVEVAAFASGETPPTSDEVERIRAINTLSLPGAYETAASVASVIAGNVMYGRPDDHVLRRKAEIEAMTPAQVAEAAATIDPATLTWVVVGDLSRIEGPVRALGLGEVTVLDADGRPVVPATP